MPTAKTKYGTKKALLDYYVYAPLGAGQLVVEKTKKLAGKAAGAAKSQRRTFVKAYAGLAGRGEKLVSSVRRSAYTRRATDQIKSARTQVKGASTTVRKAAGSTATATKAAAKKAS
ncbi:MAG TPA: hypothetical protein VGL18_15100 [Actinomycetota bacterium]|jgi:hypothetical protein